EKYGTMSLKQVLQPAIKLAEQGFRVNYYLSQDLKGLAETFLKFPASAKVFLNKGKPYQEGELFVQKDLARTLRLITKKGRDAFYQGSIAELIAEDMEKHHGLITKKDLAEYRAVEREPVQGEYRGYKIIAMGPPSSGGIALIELLNILEGFDMGQMGHNSSRALHLLTEAMRRVFADRACYLGDSDYCNVPVSGLLSKQYAHGLRESINLFQATPSSQVREGNPLPYESDQTTHYSVVDKDRLAVAVTTTINEAYGSKVVVEGTGFLLNNEMDDFSVKPGAPNLYGLIGSEANAIAPGKRMLSSMSPTIVEKDGQLFLVLGARGGPAIITSLVQVILNVIDYGLTIQEAIDAPRIHHQWLPDQLLYERVGFPYDVLENLTRMGHEVQERKGYGSEAHAIMVEPETKILLGAADSRGEGKALGY
ncbi:MAG: gamma-glutamyltransferase, partial [candidate division KSB1 bacterium]|nr:gamma-glutamyltransferase [candidate division KSB1 bacterium]